MRQRKLLCGLLAGTLAFLSAFSGNLEVDAAAIEAAVNSVFPIYSNDFEGDFEGEALVTGLEPYQGEIAYGDGFSGRAVKLGDYGLKLEQKNLGSNYTISLWVKADGAIADHTPVLFLGHHAPENWVSIAGSPMASKYKIWLKSDPSGLFHTTFAAQADAAANQWRMLTVSSDGETFSVYEDGQKIAGYADAAGKAAANVLSGENQSIYLGVNFWNWEFTGLVDNVKVYNAALSEAQIKDLYVEEIKGLFQQNGSLVKDVLGAGNLSADAVKFDLYLPEKIMNLPIVWSSSDVKVLDDSGKIYNGSEDQAVVLTGAANVNGESVEVRIPITVKALDKSELKTVMADAKRYDKKYYTAESMADLQRALKYAESVQRQSSVAQAVIRIEQAVKGLEYSEIYRNPWAVLEKAAPEKSVTVTKNATARLYTPPVQILDMVNIEYLTDNKAVVSFAGGVVKGINPGKAIVTVSVTSKYDGWRMEYSSVVTVSESKADTGDGKGDGKKGETPKKGSISGKSSVKVGKKVQFKVKGISGKVKWSVNKKSLASISSKGLLKAKKKGKVIVGAKVGGVTLKKTVTIKK